MLSAIGFALNGTAVLLDAPRLRAQVLSPGFDPENEHLFRSTFAWLSPKGTVTPTHYDISHNFFVQLQGRKQVLLFPPQSWQHLYLHPVLHPGALSAQVDVGAAPTAADALKFPHFRPEHLLGFEAEVGPGDVLYIPPLWFHRVTTLQEDSMSLSVWSPYLASGRACVSVRDRVGGRERVRVGGRAGVRAYVHAPLCSV